MGEVKSLRIEYLGAYEYGPMKVKMFQVVQRQYDPMRFMSADPAFNEMANVYRFPLEPDVIEIKTLFGERDSLYLKIDKERVNFFITSNGAIVGNPNLPDRHDYPGGPNEAYVYEQLAEECAELAHAALKQARIMRGENPTDADEYHVAESLLEEAVDVYICMDALGLVDQDGDEWQNRHLEKVKRWEKRMKEKDELNGN